MFNQSLADSCIIFDVFTGNGWLAVKALLTIFLTSRKWSATIFPVFSQALLPAGHSK